MPGQREDRQGDVRRGTEKGEEGVAAMVQSSIVTRQLSAPKYRYLTRLSSALWAPQGEDSQP